MGILSGADADPDAVGANDGAEALARSILKGDPCAPEAAKSLLSKGIAVEEILLEGVIGAWRKFAEWYDRSPTEALKGWMECYNATNRVLRALESSITPSQDRGFSAIVATVRGEGHVLMRDVISVLLRSKGVRVYSSRKGVTLEDLAEALADPGLKYVVLSCVEEGLNDQVASLIGSVRSMRPGIKVVAGGPQAEKVGADLATSDLSVLLKEMGI